jgi:hypothetical protein
MNLKTLVVVVCLGLTPLCLPSAQAQDRYPVRQISKEMHQEGFPSWSPDGKTLLFENVEPGHYGLFKVPAEGGTPVRFTSFIGERPIPSCWSRDGKSILLCLLERQSPASAIWRVVPGGEAVEFFPPV